MIGNANAKRTLVLLLLPSLLAACGGREKPAAEKALAAPPATLEVRAVAVGDRYEAMGTLRGQQTAVLTSKISGYVREIRVEAGDRVSAGALLAVLDAPELEAELRGAESAALEAEAAQAEAEAALTAAKADLALASSTYERFVKLRDQRAVTPQEFDEVETRHRAAEAQVAAAEARIDRTRSARGRAEAGVAAARVFHDYRRIEAPFAGRVLERRIDLGSLSAPGAPLFVLEKQGALRAEVSVEESLAGKIRPGDRALVSVAAEPAPLEGRVGEVVPSVDPASRAFLVKVDLPSSSETLVPGSFARVTFEIGKTERLLVPRVAVVEKGQLSMVYVVENDEPRMRLVTLGLEHGDDVEVLSGLTAGDCVVPQ